MSDQPTGDQRPEPRIHGGRRPPIFDPPDWPAEQRLYKQQERELERDRIEAQRRRDERH
jgi:hypothetical protein